MKKIIFLAKTKNDSKDKASTVYGVSVPEGFKPTDFARSFRSSVIRGDVVLPSGIERLASWGAICHDTLTGRNFKIKL